MLGVGIGINRRLLGAASYAEILTKAYEARVIADGGVVESLECFTAFATSLGAYQPPIALAATGVGEISFTANWKPFTGAKYYLLDVSTSPTFATFVYENEIIPAPATSYVVIGLNSGTTYYYRVRASTTLDADYQAVLDYATTQGYTLPSTNQQLKQNKLLLDLKAGGIWSKLDTLRVYATDGSSNFALIDWKRLSLCTAVNSPTFTTNSGYSFNGTSSYIDSGFNPDTTLGLNNYKLLDSSIGCWITIAGTTATIGMIGQLGSAGVRLQNVNTSGHRMNSSNIGTLVDLSGTELKCGNKTATNSWSIGSNTTLTTGTGGGDSNVVVNLTDGTGGGLYFNGRTAISYAGASLVAEHSDLYNALNNYMASL